MSKAADELIARRPDLLATDHTWRPGMRLASALGALAAVWFRPQHAGLERVPPGGCLLVANHNSSAPFEVLLLFRWWRSQFGERPVRGLMHRLAFELPFKLLPVGPWIGGVFAHPEVARRVLAKGDALLVFPGGDLDSCRPFTRRYEVIFGGRSGFARTAREANVPIVPVAITGAHAAYVLLPGMHRLAALLGLERRGLKTFPFSVGAALFFAAVAAALIDRALWPLAVAAFVQMFLPLPSRIVLDALDPIRPGEGETDAQVAERVRSAIEETLRRRAAERLTPWG